MRQELAAEQQQAIRTATERAEQQAQQCLQHERKLLQQQVSDQQRQA